LTCESASETLAGTVSTGPTQSLRSRPPSAVVASLSILCALAGILAFGAASAAATTDTFQYTGGEQTFEVPSGVHDLRVRLVGGAGGTGGSGAEVVSSIKVTPGQILYVEVGGNGKPAGEGSGGGFNGGGAGGSGAGGGGGASDVRTLPRSEGLAVDSRLIVAAGGGGGAGAGEEAGGAGGDAESSGTTSSGGNVGGGPGTGGGGGGGGTGCSQTGTAGELGTGGAGGNGFSTNGGGGGGGGLYGGGGGGGGCGAGGGGGGGGSSLVPGLGLVTTAVSEPEIEIKYIPPPSIEIAAPADGAGYTLGQHVTVSYACSTHEIAGLTLCAGSVSDGGTLDTSTPGPHAFLVNAEDNVGGTSSKAVAYTVLAPAPPTSTPTSMPPSGSQGKQPPDTLLGLHPGKTLKTKKSKAKVKFTFSSSTAGATFECKLDKQAFAPCSSPKSYKLKAGKHTFSVAAVNSGVTDPTPATFGFKVVRAS
jgi:Glycine rich protein